LAPLQDITSTPPHVAADPHVVQVQVSVGSASCPFQGLFPFSVFPIAQSYLSPVIPKPLVKLRPQGFTPSRRFTPRTICRAYSIPVPLLGFPFEVLILPQRRTFFRTPGPSEVYAHPKVNAPPQGFSTLQEARTVGPGLTRVLQSIPPWVSLPSRLLASGQHNSG